MTAKTGGCLSRIPRIICSVRWKIWTSRGSSCLLYTSYFNGIVLDHFIFDNSRKRRVCIITEKEALDPDADYTEDKGDFEIPLEEETEDREDF